MSEASTIRPFGSGAPNLDSAGDVRTRPWLIVGCGYTGTRLARRLLAAGAKVHATRRAPDGAAASAAASPGLGAHALDLANLVQPMDSARPEPLAWVPTGAIAIHSAPPGPASPDADRALVRALCARGVHRLVYVSSTGVYPPCAGQWIDEDHPVGPKSRRGRARLDAESAVCEQARELGLDHVSLRVVGIYGPGRGVHARLHKGTYRIIGAGDTFVNRVHVDDLGTAIATAALAPTLPARIYHVADDLPAKSRSYADEVAEIMGVPRPPSVPVADVEPWIAAMLGANRRVSNARIKRDLGLALAYPTWREGLRQVLAEDGLEA